MYEIKTAQFRLVIRRFIVLCNLKGIAEEKYMPLSLNFVLYFYDLILGIDDKP